MLRVSPDVRADCNRCATGSLIAKGRAVVAAIEQTLVSTYNYKEGTPGAAEAGLETTAGPKTQDMNKTIGDKVVPKGKKIDLIAMNSTTMAAIQSHSKKVNQIAAVSGLAAA
jgi:hypothetical protein